MAGREGFLLLEVLCALSAEAGAVAGKLARKLAAAAVDNLAATTVAQRLTVVQEQTEGTPVAEAQAAAGEVACLPHQLR
jgi:hypothetical protein